jgi:tetratricopeptide (TPR) repeat protein
MYKKIAMAAIVAALAPAAISLADIITLSDGTKVTGTMSRQGDSMIITTTDGKKLTVRAADIAGVTLTSNISPAERAENAWKQLQPSLNKVAKIEDAIALLEKFEHDNHGTPAGTKAINAIASYRQLLSQSPVKFRGAWVPKDQVEVLTRAELDAAKPIMLVYKAGKIKEAMDQTREALKTNPQNPHLNLLAGLASFKLNQLAQSREYFSKVLEVNETSLMALNNLGVVSYQVAKQIDGMGFYARALQAAPDNRLLLDNIVEALAASESLKQSPAYTALQRQFLQAETNMQAKMAKSGLFRYGSSWVSQEQHDRLLASKASVKATLEAAEARHREALRAVDNIDARIQQARVDVDTLNNEYNNWVAAAAFSYYYDPNTFTRRDLALADLDRARKRLSALIDQRVTAVETIAKVEDETAKIKLAWASVDKDMYTGVQRIMDLGDEEAVPLPSAVSVPPIVEKPPERAPVPIAVQEIPQQLVVPVERSIRPPISDYGYGHSINYGTYGSVVPPLIIGGVGYPVYVQPAQPISPLPVAGGIMQPFVPPAGPAIPRFTPAAGGGFTPGGSGR